MGVKKVEQYASGYRKAKGWTATGQAEEEMDRLAYGINVAASAVAVPRRLGPDATPEELAADKKLAKGILHRLRELLRLWQDLATVDAAEAEPDEDAAAEGARVDWEEWSEDWTADLIQRRGEVAASTVEDEPELGNRLCHLYDRELHQISEVIERSFK